MIVVLLSWLLLMQSQVVNPAVGQSTLQKPDTSASQQSRSQDSSQTPNIQSGTDLKPSTSSQPAAQPASQAVTDEQIGHDSEIATRAAWKETGSSLDTSAVNVAKQSLTPPDWLVNRKNDIIFNSQVKSINEGLRGTGLFLFVIVLGLVTLKHLGSPYTNSEISGYMVAAPIAVFFGMLGFFNEPILEIVVNVASAVIATVATVTVQQAVTPGLHVSTVASGILGAVIAFIYAIVVILLVLKMYAQIGWMMILGSVAPIYITVTHAPLLGRFGGKWWQAWFGTLIDPMLMLAGLKLAAPFLNLMSGAPDPWSQLLAVAVLLPLLTVPGWHSGAYGGSGVDWLAGLAMYRLWHMRPGASHAAAAASQGAPAAVAGGAPAAVAATTSSLPNHPYGVGGRNSGSGGGTAVTYRGRSSSWTPNYSAAPATP